MTPRIAKSNEINRALQDSNGGPLYLTDADGSVTHVVVSADAYRRLHTLFEDGDFDVRETYAAQSGALAAVWDDPELDIYNDYDANCRLAPVTFDRF